MMKTYSVKNPNLCGKLTLSDYIYRIIIITTTTAAAAVKTRWMIDLISWRVPFARSDLPIRNGDCSQHVKLHHPPPPSHLRSVTLVEQTAGVRFATSGSHPGF